MTIQDWNTVRSRLKTPAISRSGVIMTAIGLAIAYWVVKGMFEALGNVNLLPTLLAAWSPDLLFGLAGAYLLLRTPT